ncbi:NUDIX hydrolase [Oceanicola sp. 22II-s10i]|nr:NUDIX hydrolase [Oceanicola sp. 22II-s10i]OWU86715.1 NUDIX hydrolase [Oceanicola sp. 22II-s10i]
MFDYLKTTWTDYIQPMMRRPRRLQVAALCFRRTGEEGCQILLITSRGTGRWIIPKGWPITGRDAPGSAMQEAWEEAGLLRGRVEQEPVGSYFYDKTYNSGFALPVETLVYAVEVGELADSFPEASQRDRAWFTPAEAAERVNEPDLKTILRNFS